ncbi:hypothetical protein [Metabacillus schmidteae]|uniref:hypothetical protein n=1 Tax=Metabacillus schmidteae TaxID=2730405 RepID=UPI00158A88B3|nr:hypothetical protein [Metabacillus schmidteae]
MFIYNKSTIQHIFPFLFPITALFLFFSGWGGSYTIPVFVILLLLGFAYSFVSMITKKAVIGSIINLYVIGILMFGGTVVYFIAFANEI